MRASAWSVALTGIDGVPVEVEAAKGGGIPRTMLVGLPDKALNEAKERVRAAVKACDLPWPPQLLTFNLSPASLPKTGSHFDVAIAAAGMAAERAFPAHRLRDVVLIGELSLDGRVRRVPGVLPAVLAAAKAGFTRVVVPYEQEAEAALVPGIQATGVDRLDEVVAFLKGKPLPQRAPRSAADEGPDASAYRPDLAEVVGHEEGRFVLEVAAAGRHHLYLYGAPGVGKSMLASRLPSILPQLDDAEAVEVSAIHSLAGIPLDGLIRQPPFADPHHSVTPAALVGGGSAQFKPGAISLAHNGVLFLDECPEFGPKLDALRTPLECGWITINRARYSARIPAGFQLILAANPCPCGYHAVAGAQCRCDPLRVRRYQDRVSGPILDRIDIRHQLTSVNRVLLDIGLPAPESSAVVRERVLEARDRQRARLRGTPWTTNGEIAGSYLRKELTPATDLRLLNEALLRGSISARGVDKVLRVAWTLADLGGHDRISERDIRSALLLRQGAARELAS